MKPSAKPVFEFPELTTAADIDRAAAEYARGLVDLLHEQLLEVISLRQPGILPHFSGETAIPEQDTGLLPSLLQAWGIWFQLLNIAEENTGMRRRRVTERTLGLEHVPGTFANVLQQAKDRGLAREEIQQLLTRLRVTPTITAHPTEAKRVTVLQIHRRIYVILYRLEATRWTPREREDLIRQLRDEIDLLWLTGELRLEKPSVSQEVNWGLHFFEQTLYERVPETLERLDWALKRIYPGADFNIPPFFQFGSWIGGDRDGNPFVTNTATREALLSNREAVLVHYQRRISDIVRTLSVSSHAITPSATYLQQLQEQLQQSGHGKRIEKRNPGEIFRQYAICIQEKLAATLKKSSVSRNRYNSADEFITDLKNMEEGLTVANCAHLAGSQITPLLREALAFRFRTVRLDLRENITVINATLQQIWMLMHADETPPDEDSADWHEWIKSELSKPQPELPHLPLKDRQAASTLGLFRLIADCRDTLDNEAVGGFILSMTQTEHDVLGVYLLAKYTGLFSDDHAVERCSLPVIPLFETIEDLRAAPKIMRALFNIPLVRRSLKDQGNLQEVMIGYSDSNKDGGFVTSNYELSRAQAELTRISVECRIPVVFFHGRGGSVSRGGAPTGRAIAAQPAGSVNGKLRITEQGEVVSSKYANHGTAQYQMELLAASVFEHTLKSMAEDELRPNPEHDQALEALSSLAYTAYRRFAESSGLLDYYNAASPVDELAKLKIGSRPARRFGAKTLDDLRAIPWVFAWTQNRHHVPAWFGLGSAIREFVRVRDDTGRAILQEMYEHSRLFRLIIDEAEKSLAFVDIEVMRAYAGLVTDTSLRERLLQMFMQEYEHSMEGVLQITGDGQLAQRFTRFSRKYARRAGILRQAGLAQARLVKRFREEGKRDDLIALLLSINCVSAGLGWTG